MPRRKGSPESPDIDRLGPGTECWEYARDSGGDRQGKSVPDQVAEMDREVAARGWVVTDRFLDKKRKGGDAGRQEFNRLLERLEERPVRVPVLLNWDIRRLARDEGLGYELLAHTYQAGVAIHSVSFPLPAAARRYVEPFLIVSAADESRAKGKDVKRGLDDMMARGYAPGGKPPVGYAVEYHEVTTDRETRRWPKWVQDPAWQERVSTAWQMRLQGLSYRQILRATGIVKASASLADIFDNPTYCGFPSWWLNCKGLDLVDCQELAPIVPPYVSLPEWLSCQRVPGYHPRREGSGYPLSGMGRCACKLFLEVHSHHQGGPYRYRCPSSHHKAGKCGRSNPIGGWQLEHLILEALVPHFTGERIREAVSETNASLEMMYQTVSAERTRWTERAEVLKGELYNLTQSLAAAGPSEWLLQALHDKETELNQARAELAMLPERLEPVAIDPGEVDAWAKMFREEVFLLDREGLRTLFQGLGLHYTLRQDRVECRIQWPPLQLLLGVYGASAPWGYYHTPALPEHVLELVIPLPLRQAA